MAQTGDVEAQPLDAVRGSSRTLAAFDRTAGNLALMARQPEASAALHTVWTGLFNDWLDPVEMQEAPRRSEWRDVRPLPGSTH